MEVYKKIVGFNDYEISNYGNVISHKTNKLKQIKIQVHKGYCRFGARNTQDKVTKTLKVHREVYKSFKLEDITNYEINHIDGNKSNNNLNNLEKVTHKQDMVHAAINNLLVKGSKSKSSKLKESDIQIIKDLYNKNKESQRSIAKKYNVSHTTIKHIINGTKWRL